MQSAANTSLLEDEKKYRKLRKVLRQIENLNLLPRCLNEEEKTKVLKRDEYRKQLKELNMKYPNNELSFRDNQNTSFELEHSQLTNNSNLNESDSNLNVVSAQNESFENNLNELTSKMDSLIIEKPTDQAIHNQKIKAEVVQESKSSRPIATETLEVRKNEKQQKKQQQQSIELVKQAPKPVVCFDSYEVKNAHEELIVSLDICNESKLIVTGSRDTSIKVWSYENLKKIKLVHSFGGHSSSITLVRFWAKVFYEQCLANQALQNGEELNNDDDGDDDKSSEDTENLNYPLIVSSSLDCSIRIWDICKGACVKEIYLYNPVNHFQINETMFLVGLEAGKLQYLDNLTQIATMKAFDDVDSVCCVQLFNDKETKKVYALSQTGLLKVFNILKIEEKQSFELIKESNVYSLLAKKYSLQKHFKSFEIVSEDKVLLMNDNQSFLIFYNLAQNTYEFISTNTTSYGFTSCFYKLNSLFFISAYNIDDETSNINVFDYSADSFQYCYTLQNTGAQTAFSALNCIMFNENKSYLVVSSCRGQLVIWSVSELLNDVFLKSNKKQVKLFKMCKRFNFHAESANEESEDENEEGDTQEKEKDKDLNANQRYCSIQ